VVGVSQPQLTVEIGMSQQSMMGHKVICGALGDSAQKALKLFGGINMVPGTKITFLDPLVALTPKRTFVFFLIFQSIAFLAEDLEKGSRPWGPSLRRLRGWGGVWKGGSNPPPLPQKSIIQEPWRTPMASVFSAAGLGCSGFFSLKYRTVPILTRIGNGVLLPVEKLVCIRRVGAHGCVSGFGDSAMFISSVQALPSVKAPLDVVCKF